jgi:hypothetical protein
MHSDTRFRTTRPITSRGFVFAFICLAMLAAGCSKSETADGPLDTSRLPRVAGAKEVFASAATTIFTSPDSIAQTADTVGKALAAGGWQPYVAPFTAQTTDPNLRITSFKKGPQALNVFITLAPAQGNATSVSYTAVALKNDLPFPKDATNIEFDPNKLLLTCVTAETLDNTLVNYRKELDTLGWSLWSAKTGEKQSAGGRSGELTERGAYAHYVNDKQQSLALVLVLQRRDDGRINVDLKGWPIGILEAERQAEINRNKPKDTTPAVAAEPPAARTAPMAAKPEQRKSATDDTVDEIMKQAQQAVRDATAEALAGLKSQPKAQAPKGPEKTLGVLVGNKAPVPVPETAEDIEFDGAGGTLKFFSTSSINALAAFYRAAMKPLGWKETPSVIKRDNMVVLDFSKGDKDISFTIMKIGNQVNVSADGSALEIAAAKPAAPVVAPSPNAQPAAAPAQVTGQDLEAEQSGGLPVPKRHTMTVGDQSPFRRAVTASVPVDPAAVLAFYRRELGKLNWKEETKGAVITPDRAVIAFSSSDGPAVLKLGRKDGETSVNLAVRNPDAAAKAGMMPKSGQCKLLFGNANGAEAVITINKQTIKVAGGAGSKGPDGPTLDLPPGKYTYSLKLAGRPAQNGEVEVGADETWGLLIGPGGVLPLHMY